MTDNFRFDNATRERLIAVLEDQPWGDIENAITDATEFLDYLLALGKYDYARWNRHGGNDETEMPITEVRTLSDSDRAALAAANVTALSYRWYDLGLLQMLTQLRDAMNSDEISRSPAV